MPMNVLNRSARSNRPSLLRGSITPFQTWARGRPLPSSIPWHRGTACGRGGGISCSGPLSLVKNTIVLSS